LLRQRQLDTENAAALARQIDEKKEEKRRLRVFSTPTEVPDNETFDGGIATNVFAFNTEIKCKGYLFHSVALSNPINGMLST
jgi:hypothetical protein